MKTLNHLVISLFFIALFASTALATWEPGMDVSMIHIEVSDGDDSGDFTYFFPPGLAKSERYDWHLPQAAIINGKGKGKPMATLDALSVEYIVDPVVDLNFAVTAGNADTTFTITTAIMPFSTLTNPDAYATAAVTVTDLNQNGASINGLLDSDKIYQAIANGTAWASLVDSFTVAPYDSEIGKERMPSVAPNWGTIAGSVNSIQSQFSFTLSAYDSASATSHFEVVVPEPATIALLSIGGLLLRKRK